MAEENTSLGMSPTDPTAPPSYDATQQDGSPPSYQSIFGQIKSEKEKNANPVGFIGSVVKILLGTFIVTLFMALMLAIPITMVAIGAVYLDDCPAERFIPIYLITMGVAYIVKSLIDLKGRAQRSRLPKKNRPTSNPTKWRADSAISSEYSASHFSLPEMYGSIESTSQTPRSVLMQTTATQRSTTSPSG
ncbi:uncharacterized protein LOC754214 [Strongylocentrotus purpuratus]|uniref:Uncharacterized protein n=1 Tax=Strongylocentrotus purpuratus TaxID=7668 RepID=A0A7M7NGW4_STRPU|nr:uncharacterized protein LOC754214 [Strongylocentrotus purpuratus]